MEYVIGFVAIVGIVGYVMHRLINSINKEDIAYAEQAEQERFDNKDFPY